MHEKLIEVTRASPTAIVSRVATELPVKLSNSCEGGFAPDVAPPSPTLASVATSWLEFYRDKRLWIRHFRIVSEGFAR